MERSRFVTIALVVFSALTVVHARHIVAFSITQLCVVLAIAVAVHVTAMLCSSRRRLQPISPLISFAILVGFLLIANAHGIFSRMIPTPATLVDLVHDTRHGIVVMRAGTVPFGFSISVFLVAIVVTWVMAEIAETLAQRLHSSAPTLLWYLLINAGIAAQKGTGLLTIAILFICGASWFFLYAFDRGHERSRSHIIAIPRSSQMSNIATYLIAFFALGLMSLFLVVPVKNIPSLAPKNVFHFLNGTSDQTELSPLVGMKQQLNGPRTQVLFTATSTEAQYWRVAVLNDFDGETWSLSSRTKQKPETSPDGITSHVTTATVDLTTLAPKFLPTYYSTQSVSPRDVDFLQHSVVYSKKSSLSHYTLTALVPPATLTPEQINASSDDPPKSVESSALLPTNFDKKIIAQAQNIARSRSSIYEQVIALRDFFLDGSFVYDLHVNYASSTNAMEQFLKTRHGFCEQFATTYAAMARSIGIPARVVVGFTPGTPDANGRFTITNQQAHSWVEVYLSHFGWLTIDPTPSGALPGQAPTNIGAVVTTTTTTTVAPPITQPVTTNVTPTTQASHHRASLSSKKSEMSLIFAMIGILVIGAACAYVVVRRKKRHQSKNDEMYVIQTFREIGERVLNVTPRPDLTIAELAERVPENNEVIREFLALLTLASYAPEGNISWHELRKAAAKARSDKISSSTK